MSVPLTRVAAVLLLLSGALHADSERLATVLAAQPEEMQARYGSRHPAETLSLFGIEPGMTVVEALPGGGWYTRILLPYLGDEGTLIGADYAVDMYPLFGFFSDEQLAAKKTWRTSFIEDAMSWRAGSATNVDAFAFGSLPEAMHGTADAVLFVRALHNLSRFEGQGGYLTQALAEAHAVLKPGGIVGVVQHEVGEHVPDDWAMGGRGYLKKSAVIKRVEAAGFELVDDSAINSNPADQPGADDAVWRLPPTLSTSREDEALRKQLQAVGESNRMTLKFRKQN